MADADRTALPDFSDSTENRLLIVPATRRDADAINGLLNTVGITTVVCSSIPHLLQEIGRGVGAVMISEEFLKQDYSSLEKYLQIQAPWSDLPVIILSRAGHESKLLSAATASLGNVSVLERPVRMTTLLSVVNVAIRARRRQYQVRKILHENERVEKEIRFGREHLELVVQGANVGVWYCPLPFGELVWDAKVKEHFFISEAESVSIEQFYARLHPDDVEATQAAINSSITSNVPYNIVFRTLSADGSQTKWIHALGRAFQDSQGIPVRFDGITTDVSERVKAEEELRATADRLLLATETGKLGIWELDVGQMQLSCTETCKKHLGCNNESDLKFADLRKYIHQDDIEQVEQSIRTCIESQTDFEVECRTISEHKSVHWILIRGRLRRRIAELSNSLVGVTLDISEGKNLELRRAELLESERAARQVAERAGHLKDEFLATLSHELRTPLNAIVGWAQLLRMDGLDDDQRAEGLDVIDRNARAQAKIIEDLLDMSRIVSGKIRLEVHRVSLIDILRSAIATVTPAANVKNIEIVSSFEPSELVMHGDPDRLQQVMWNLLSNAVKFTPENGKVTVDAQHVDNCMQIRVADNGVGIAPDFVTKMFDRFRQADGTTTRRHGGLGLGLAIVRQLIELHGGTIEVNSEGLGRGSEFTVKLPVGLRLSGSRTEQPIVPLDPAKGDLICDLPALNGVKILVVDDEPDVRNLLKRMLEERSAQVYLASSAQEAFHLVPICLPDVIISDIGMPYEDGYSFIKRVRALPASAGGQSPAIALTAYARAEDRRLALEAGFQHHLTKPVAPSALLNLMFSMLN